MFISHLFSDTPSSIVLNCEERKYNAVYGVLIDVLCVVSVTTIKQITGRLDSGAGK